MTKLLLDTNALVYVIDENSKFFSYIRKLLSKPGYEFYTTSKNIAEFLAVVTKYPKPALDIKSALIAVKDFQSHFQILYPSESSFSLFIELAEKYQPAGLLIHDVEIASIALANHIDTVVTFNTKDFTLFTEIKIFSFQ